MTDAWSAADVNGEPPALAGLVCEALQCLAYSVHGEVIDPANTIHLRFDGVCRRLYFDTGIVFWRPDEGQPEPYAIDEEGTAWAVIDVAADAGVVGARLVDYDMRWKETFAEVNFRFESCTVVFRNTYADDVTTWRIERP